MEEVIAQDIAETEAQIEELENKVIREEKHRIYELKFLIKERTAQLRNKKRNKYKRKVNEARTRLAKLRELREDGENFGERSYKCLLSNFGVLAEALKSHYGEDRVDVVFEVKKTKQGYVRDKGWFDMEHVVKTNKNRRIFKTLTTRNVWSFNRHITVHFPEFILSSSGGIKHKIRDLYVRFNKHLHFEGARTTVTYKEYRNGYGHSHLNSSQAFANFTGFCVGGGNVFSTVISEIRYNYIDKQKAELLCYQLESYVGWESIAGGPYIRVRNTARGNSIDVSSNASSDEGLPIVRMFPSLPLAINKRPDYFSFNLDYEAFEKLFNQYSTLSKNFYKSPEGLYYDTLEISDEEDMLESANMDNDQLHIIFKGEKVPFKIVRSDNVGKMEGNSVDPNLIKRTYNHVVFRINQILNNE